MASNPDLLVARVFKLRYSRDGDLLEASARPGCSYVWHSVIGSREVLEVGAKWKVGNGERVKVYGDKWVEGNEIVRLEGVDGRRDPQRRVKDLLRDDGRWDVEMVKSLFNEFESEVILGMKREEFMREDVRWWVLEAKGSFSVKSCYLAQVGFYRRHDHLSSEDRKRWSRMVWQVSVPPKVKIFMWRACLNIIPTMGNLRDHHVPIEGMCPLCQNRWATTEHMLVFCPRVRGIWKASGFWRGMKGGDLAAFVDIADRMERELEEENYAVWCLLVWKVWSFICDVLHGKCEMERTPSVEECWWLWELTQKAKVLMDSEMRLGVKCGARKWSKPERGVMRVDVDAMFNEKENCFGVGVILRDSEGRVWGALSKKTTRRANVMIAEAMAVVEGIIFSIKCKAEVITIFTDSLLVARIMADEDEFGELLPADFCDILKKAREDLLVDIFHMYRSANRAAHLLAQRSSDFDDEMVWIDSYPPWLREIVIDEASDE